MSPNMQIFSLVSHSVWPYTGSDVIRIPTMTSHDVIRTSTMTSIVWVWVCDTSLSGSRGSKWYTDFGYMPLCSGGVWQQRLIALYYGKILGWKNVQSLFFVQNLSVVRG